MGRSWDDLSNDEKQSFREKASDVSNRAENLKAQFYAKAGKDENGREISEDDIYKNKGENTGSFFNGVFSFLGGMMKSLEKIMDNYSKKR